MDGKDFLNAYKRIFPQLQNFAIAFTKRRQNHKKPLQKNEKN